MWWLRQHAVDKSTQPACTSSEASCAALRRVLRCAGGGMGWEGQGQGMPYGGGGGMGGPPPQAAAAAAGGNQRPRPKGDGVRPFKQPKLGLHDYSQHFVDTQQRPQNFIVRECACTIWVGSTSDPHAATQARVVRAGNLGCCCLNSTPPPLTPSNKHRLCAGGSF
jgi:hypothetical protein